MQDAQDITEYMQDAQDITEYIVIEFKTDCYRYYKKYF